MEDQVDSFRAKTYPQFWGRNGVTVVEVAPAKNAESDAVIAVPVMGSDDTSVQEQWRIAAQKKADLIEWRADAVTDLADLSVGRRLHDKYATPVLVTIRTVREGGSFEYQLPEDDHFCALVLEASQWAEAVDVEFALPGAVALAEQAQKSGAAVVFSHHVFGQEVTAEAIQRILLSMAQSGADVAKIAWQVSSDEGLQTVLDAQKWASLNVPIPVVVIAMGESGAATRLGAGARRNAFTFAVGARPSAPGQLSIEKVRDSLR